jgi:hypothetical protein
MSDRFKPYLIIIVSLLLVGIFLNVPVAFATKLPTACNVFHPNPVIKSGPCGHQAVFSKDKCLEMGIFPYSLTNVEIPDSITDVGSFSLSPVFPAIFPDLLPLRC